VVVEVENLMHKDLLVVLVVEEETVEVVDVPVVDLVFAVKEMLVQVEQVRVVVAAVELVQPALVKMVEMV